MKLTPAQLSEISSLVNVALDLPTSERAAWARSRLPITTEPAVRQALEAMFSGDGSETQFTFALEQRNAQAPRIEAEPGDVVDTYRLIEKIGSGGMGDVWLAERADGAITRRVALKLPHLHQATSVNAHLALRHSREREILSGLNHPNIARLFDVGTATVGNVSVPYLALEYVAGESITHYCDARKLDVIARLKLVQQLLAAMGAAHRNLVVHRDIKPNNILVDASGQVKLLDFGIAKPVGAAEEEAGLSAPLDAKGAADDLTQVAGVALTPSYASPEHIMGNAITTQSDLYSAGVVLYELLCGQRPNEVKWIGAGSIDSTTLQNIKPLSAVALTDVAADLRQTTAQRFTRWARPDVEAILTKALRFDPQQRYASAESFSRDIDNLLQSRTVEARVATPWYAARKFVMRNRWAVSAGGAALVAVVALAGVAVVQRGNAVAQTAVAVAQSARAKAVTDFMAKLFEENNPENALGKQLSAVEMLDRGAGRVDTELAKQPEVLAEIQARLGGIYLALGEHLKAGKLLEKSVKQYEAIGVVNTVDYFNALYSLAEFFFQEDQHADTVRTAGKLREQSERIFRVPNQWTGKTLALLAETATMTGNAVQGEKLARQAIALQEKFLGNSDIASVTASNYLANALADQGRVIEARAVYQSMVDHAAQVTGFKSMDNVLVWRYGVARMDFYRNEFKQAAAALMRIVPEMETVIGVAHPRTVDARSLFSQTLTALGQFDEAVALQRVNLKITETLPAVDGEAVGLQRLTLAKLLTAAGRPLDAERLAQQGFAVFEKKYAVSPTFHRERGRWIVADAQLNQGKLDAALVAIEKALKFMREVDGYAANLGYAEVLQSYALVLRAKGKFIEARAAMNEAATIFNAKLANGAPQRTQAAFIDAWIAASEEPFNANHPALAAFADTKNRALALVSEGHLHRGNTQAVAKFIDARMSAKPLVGATGKEALPLTLYAPRERLSASR